MRVYVRMPDRKKVRMREPIGSPEFMFQYNRTIAEIVVDRGILREGRTSSFRNLCVRYYSSAAFRSLDAHTQVWRRYHLDLLAQDHGDKPVSMLEPKHIRRLRE